MNAKATVAVLDRKDGSTLTRGDVTAWGRPVTLKLENPLLWSPGSPNLYFLEFTLTAQDGFRFGVNLYTSAGAFSSDSGWQTSYTIPRYSFFRMTIARTSESTSETADIAEFVASISAQSQVVREIDIALAGKVAVQQGAANADKALVVGNDFLSDLGKGHAVEALHVAHLNTAEFETHHGRIVTASILHITRIILILPGQPVERIVLMTEHDTFLAERVESLHQLLSLRLFRFSLLCC